jgi:hypothetical protein
MEDLSARIYRETPRHEEEGYEIVDERPAPQAAQHVHHDEHSDDEDEPTHEHEEHEDDSGASDGEEERHARAPSNRPARRRKPKDDDGNQDESAMGDLDELPDFSTDVGDPDDFL